MNEQKLNADLREGFCIKKPPGEPAAFKGEITPSCPGDCFLVYSDEVAAGTQADVARRLECQRTQVVHAAHRQTRVRDDSAIARDWSASIVYQLLADLTRGKAASMEPLNQVAFVLVQVRVAHTQFHLAVKLPRLPRLGHLTPSGNAFQD
ncbi:hypothetical protein SAMN05216570_1175 [Dyella sp. OK004]|uniref:hypothetical protein n=1 Tax=Dyella sp. OK004 TaxID=1855292 RepID=UPI0008E6B3E7|nr:hypothetical protein [Dyella sp. OK004]SFR95322.1 hypothetical protein SAMN05216570_1175 [Dyella sp. OK004]